MSDLETNGREDDGSDADQDAVTTAAASTHKVKGEFSSGDGAGVLGINNSSSGTPIGVQGAVPNNSTGFGLQTPDDAKVGGSLETTSLIMESSTLGTSFHHRGEAGSNDSAPSDHMARFEDTLDFDDGDLVAIQTGYTGTPSSGTNFITFFDGNRDALGRIEGNGSGGVQFNSGGADYAEYLPRLNRGEDIEAHDVVGIVEGAVTKRTSDADRVLVVSEAPIVTGNSPGHEPEARQEYETVAFVGQVPVKVRGPVEEGDLVVPTGEDDGIGLAIASTEFRPGDGPIVGRAWESDDTEGVTQVTVAVGLETGEVLAPILVNQQETIQNLEAEADRKDERIKFLEQRLGALEDHVAGFVSDTGESATPADD